MHELRKPGRCNIEENLSSHGFSYKLLDKIVKIHIQYTDSNPGMRVYCFHISDSMYKSCQWYRNENNISITLGPQPNPIKAIRWRQKTATVMPWWQFMVTCSFPRKESLLRTIKITKIHINQFFILLELKGNLKKFWRELFYRCSLFYLK